MAQLGNIGRYKLESEIGRGAMGVVYKAVDPILDRVVAIKAIDMAIGSREMEHYEERFILEARAAARLNHSSIVTIYDIGRSGDLAYMAMEFLEGRELKDLMGSSELTLSRALEIAAQVADGLAYSHEHGVVHRDVKPANIMILPGDRVKITDFGIARTRSAEAQADTKVVLGSPRYLSPEQALGQPCDARSDIFSLGVIIYEMITGRMPFDAADLDSLMYQIANAEPPTPSIVNPDVPVMLDLIIAKALAKKADERYANMAHLAIDLGECLRQGVGTATIAPSRSPGEIDTASITAELWVETVPVSIGDEVGASVSIDAMPAHRFAKEFDGSEAEIESIDSTDAMPAHGLAKEFDSSEAIMRFKAADSALVRSDALATRPVGRTSRDRDAMDSKRSPSESAARSATPGKPWSRLERTLFLGAVTGAIALGIAVILV